MDFFASLAYVKTELLVTGGPNFILNVRGNVSVLQQLIEKLFSWEKPRFFLSFIET